MTQRIVLSCWLTGGNCEGGQRFLKDYKFSKKSKLFYYPFKREKNLYLQINFEYVPLNEMLLLPVHTQKLYSFAFLNFEQITEHIEYTLIKIEATLCYMFWSAALVFTFLSADF